MNGIDLSQLPVPAVIEALDFEEIYQDLQAYFQGAMGAGWTAMLESDPAVKLLEVFAYREMMLRARINDAARAVMLAYAIKSDLDQLGANANVQRLLIDAGDTQAIPPRLPTYESDDDFRRRIQLSPEGYTTAGSEQSYVFHGLSADPAVADIGVASPLPGTVTIYVLSREGNGVASEALQAAVAMALNKEKVRPMTDQVTVQSAHILNYSIVAELEVLPGPDSAVVRAAAQEAAALYTASQHRMSRDIPRSGVYAALHQPGVQRVNLISPVTDLTLGEGESAYCTAITLTIAGDTDV